jgi:molybdopterin molybdotransferase
MKLENTPAAMLSLERALSLVNEKLAAANLQPGKEMVPLGEGAGRALAEDVFADRDYPPFPRSIRDGFAVRAEDVESTPVELSLRGEVRAGGHFTGEVGAGECVSIMTGAPLPAGADAVVMVEYTESRGGRVKIERAVGPRENVVQQGSEARSGTCVLPRGCRLSPLELGLLAAVGKAQVAVFARPSVAILPTGDEVVPVARQPEWFQIRNSNAIMLCAQVAAAGGVPHCLEVAPDQPEALRQLIEKGLGADLLLLTGGVSAGKYDFVEQVLADLGAEFYFQSVALRPGKPLVFGKAAGKFFFGLPGNPLSSFVTFALFARPAVAVLGGALFEAPIFLRARLAQPTQQRTGLTAVLPARIELNSGDPTVSLVGWHGSGDLVAVVTANCFVVLHPDQTNLAAGDWVEVMPKVQ